MLRSHLNLKSQAVRGVSGSVSSDYHSTNEFSSEGNCLRYDDASNTYQASESPILSMRDRCFSFKKNQIPKYKHHQWISRLPKRIHILVEKNHGLCNLQFRSITKNGPVIEYVAVPDSNINAHQSQKMKQRTSSYCVGEQIVSTVLRASMSVGYLQPTEPIPEYPSSPVSIQSPRAQQKWLHLRDSLLAGIKERLSRDNMFKIKDSVGSNLEFQEAESESVASPTKTSSGAKPIVIGQISSQQELALITHLITSQKSSTELISYCTETKENSLRLQCFLERCSPAETRRVGGIIEPYYGELITHRIGNYVLKKLVELDNEVTLPSLAEYCHSRFTVLIKNEYSSRVIQSLIEANEEFRRFTLKYFAEHFHECLENTAVVFLIISAIRFAQDSTETSFVKDTLKRSPQLLGIKVFQRVLVSYVQHCDSQSLEEVSTLIKPEINLRRLLNEKFSTYIILTLLQRKVEIITQILCRAIRTDIEELFETKFFKLLINKLFELKQEDLSERLSSHLTSLSTSQLLKLASRSSYFLFYLYVAFNSFGDSRVRNFVKFYKRLSSHPTLRFFLSIRQQQGNLSRN
jgi:Pumilio-family RNA binding repeat